MFINRPGYRSALAVFALPAGFRCFKLAGMMVWLAAVVPAFANLPGGGTGTGPSVTLTDNGGSVTMANGTISIVIVKSSANITNISYTYNNSGSPTTYSILNGGKDGGEFYWELG